MAVECPCCRILRVSWRHAMNEARWWVTAPSHGICGRDGSLEVSYTPVPLQSIPASVTLQAVYGNRWRPMHPGRPSAGTSEVTRRCREFRNTAVLDSRVPLAAVDGLGSAPCTVEACPHACTGSATLGGTNPISLTTGAQRSHSSGCSLSAPTCVLQAGSSWSAGTIGFVWRAQAMCCAAVPPLERPASYTLLRPATSRAPVVPAAVALAAVGAGNAHRHLASALLQLSACSISAKLSLAGCLRRGHQLRLADDESIAQRVHAVARRLHALGR